MRLAARALKTKANGLEKERKQRGVGWGGMQAVINIAQVASVCVCVCVCVCLQTDHTGRKTSKDDHAVIIQMTKKSVLE